MIRRRLEWVRARLAMAAGAKTAVRGRHARRASLAGIVATAVVLILTAPSAFAAAPSGSGTVTASGGAAPSGASSAEWLALKNAYRVRSGVTRNQAKGGVAQLSIAATPLQTRPLTSGGGLAPSVIACDPNAQPPCSDELSTANAVPNIFEPGAGCTANYGANTSSSDDLNHGYCADTNFFNLCGPGAADVAMWYWPAPPNLVDKHNVVDPKHNSTSTSWNGYDKDNVPRTRGYMAYLAFQMKASGWTQPGLMEQYAPGGVRLQEERIAMNWEENGHTSNNGFYIVQWHYDPNLNPGGGTDVTLHSQVASDIYFNNVPVVAEVNARKLPNWSSSGAQVLHFITIIGYDDLVRNADGSFGKYYYTDTCASSTTCGSHNDGGVNSASYAQMWTAIMSAPYSPSTGDGGWIW